MGESFKAVCAFILIVATIVAAVVWTDTRPTETTWITRGVSSLVAVMTLTTLVALQLRRDAAHDYLHDAAGSYFNRGGFCFAFEAVAENGVCYFRAHYQNQFERPCIGQIAVRPARGFWLTRARIETMTFQIDCDAGAYGVATLPIPVPQEIQGKRQAFEVGASVNYPQGKGRRLRYRDGAFLRTNSNFGNTFATAVTVVGAMSGSIILSKPATALVEMPDSVTEELPDVLTPRTTVIWKLGDPPIV
jgi:hypothetical protein